MDTLSTIEGIQETFINNSRNLTEATEDILLQAFFVYTRGPRCLPFLFISDEHIFKQSKKSMFQNNFYK